MRWKDHHIIGLMLCALVIPGGCSMDTGPVYTKDGQRYGLSGNQVWRGQWWQYYERALSYAAGEYWDEAIADLKQALGTRLGQQDQRRANTYGLHFVENYFPHRELGIIYYQLGRYQDALDELTTSMNQTESAKAKFYINRVRRALLQQTQRDVRPPRVVIEHPRDGELTNRLALDITGYAADDTYVSKVVINGQPLFIELAEPRQAFSHQVVLNDGPNTLTVAAIDLQGRQTAEQRTVVLDRHGPLLSVTSVDFLDGLSRQRVRIQGVISDQSRITRFQLAGQSMPLPASPDGGFHQEVPRPKDANTLPFEVEDAAGNITRGAISLVTDTDIRHGHRVSPHRPRWAGLTATDVVADVPPWSAMPIRIAQQDRPKEQDPPRITLSEFDAREIVYENAVYLEGQVTDASLIKAFSIDATPYLKHMSRQLFFNFQANLRPGPNGFVMEAKDEWDNRVERAIRITHQPPPQRHIKARLQVALAPFVNKGRTEVLSVSVFDHLSGALLDQKRFDLIDRTLAASRQSLEQAPEAAKAGKAMGAEGILIGSVIESEAKQSLEVIARLVDVESAKVMAVEDVYGEQLTSRDVKTLMAGLALKLRRRFPLQEGTIWEQSGDMIWVEFPDAKGIQKGTKLMIFQQGRTLMRSGRKRRLPPRQLGEARIEEEAELWGGASVERDATDRRGNS